MIQYNSKEFMIIAKMHRSINRIKKRKESKTKTKEQNFFLKYRNKSFLPFTTSSRLSSAIFSNDLPEQFDQITL